MNDTGRLPACATRSSSCKEEVDRDMALPGISRLTELKHELLMETRGNR